MYLTFSIYYGAFAFFIWLGLQFDYLRKIVRLKPILELRPPAMFILKLLNKTTFIQILLKPQLLLKYTDIVLNRTIISKCVRAPG